LEKGQADDWFADFWIRTFSVSAFLGIIAFIWHELSTEHPSINLRVLKNSNLIASNVLTFVCGFGLFGSVFVFPVVVQRIMGYSPTDAGLAIVPGALMGLVMMPFIGKRLQAGTSPIYFVVIGFIAFMLHGYLSSLANLDAGKNWFIVPQIFRGMGTACLTVPLINQAVVGLAPKDMPSGIALTNMLRQLGGAFGIAVMNTYVSRRFAIHRTDLVSNLQPNDPETLERLNNYTQGAIARGFNALEAKQMSFGILEGAVTKQSFLLSYMDAFFLITLFFICASPFILMLRVKKLDKATQAKVAEEAH
jgi:DHA2 family multidrug resistance protein